MKSHEPTSTSTFVPPWEISLERTILPVERITLEEIPPSDAAVLQDEAVTRTVNILRDKISGS
ncbi:MAG: hypothetical protein PHU93_05100 [Candidatus Gracilibacteria bacterium]|nr:hypothetical protein [Candidatus Gracilibacteria bacterium]